MIRLLELFRRLRWDADDPELPVKIYGKRDCYGAWYGFDPEIAEDWRMLNMYVIDWRIDDEYVAYGAFHKQEMLIVTIDDDVPEDWNEQENS